MTWLKNMPWPRPRRPPKHRSYDIHPGLSQDALMEAARRWSGCRSVPESFTCPVCGKTSYHPKDIEHGYCGNCHDFTGATP